MGNAYLRFCNDLNSSMYRVELYNLARNLNLPVNSNTTKRELCAAIAMHAVTPGGMTRRVTPGGMTRQRGGYFDATLNRYIDEDIGGANEPDVEDLASDLYQYNAGNDDSGEDPEDDDEDDEDEESYQVGGGNFEAYVPIGRVHRSYIAQLFKQLPVIRAGAKARLEFQEEKKKSDKNFAGGYVWIVTQNKALLEELNRKTAEYIRTLEDENALRNPNSKSSFSAKSSSARMPSSGFEEIVKLPGPIHKRFIGELIKSFTTFREEFEDAKFQYIPTSDDGNIGMGYVVISIPTSKEDAVALSNEVEAEIQRIFQKAEEDRKESLAKAKEKAKAKGSVRNMKEELFGPDAEASSTSSTKSATRSPAGSPTRSPARSPAGSPRTSATSTASTASTASTSVPVTSAITRGVPLGWSTKSITNWADEDSDND